MKFPTELRRWGPHPEGGWGPCEACQHIMAEVDLPPRHLWGGSWGPVPTEHFLIEFLEEPCSCGFYLSEGRPPAHPEDVDRARRSLPIGKETPAEWLAHTKVRAWPYATHRYDEVDPEVEGWVAEATRQLFGELPPSLPKSPERDHEARRG